MPIVDLAIVVPPAAPLPAGLAQGLADDLGRCLNTPPGRLWVRLRPLDAGNYAENGCTVEDDELPVFVTVLHAEPPTGEALDAEMAVITDAVARVTGRPVSRVHLEYAAAGRGRLAFGGQPLADLATRRRLAVAGTGIGVLSLGYALVLAAGLLTLPSPEHPIQDPWFTAMEGLILLIAPAMLVFLVALHRWVPRQGRSSALLGVVFMALCCVVTCSVHFAILFLAREPAIAAQPWAPQVFSFRWPSVVYALDILAWDFFFPLSALFVARSVQGTSLGGRVQALLMASAVLAFLGLLGVPLANMNVRNVGIVGYAVLFPIAASLAAWAVHRRGAPRAPQRSHGQRSRG